MSELISQMAQALANILALALTGKLIGRALPASIPVRALAAQQVIPPTLLELGFREWRGFALGFWYKRIWSEDPSKANVLLSLIEEERSIPNVIESIDLVSGFHAALWGLAPTGELERLVNLCRTLWERYKAGPDVPMEISSEVMDIVRREFTMATRPGHTDRDLLQFLRFSWLFSLPEDPQYGGAVPFVAFTSYELADTMLGSAGMSSLVRGIRLPMGIVGSLTERLPDLGVEITAPFFEMRGVKALLRRLAPLVRASGLRRLLVMEAIDTTFVVGSVEIYGRAVLGAAIPSTKAIVLFPPIHPAVLAHELVHVYSPDMAEGQVILQTPIVLERYFSAWELSRYSTPEYWRWSAIGGHIETFPL